MTDSNSSGRSRPQRRRSEPPGLIEGRLRRDAAHWQNANGRAASFFEFGRVAMLRLLIEKPSATVNDLREVYPLREGIKPAVYGTILQSLARLKLIRPVSREQTSRPIAHARKIERWELTDLQRAIEWLRGQGHDVPQPGTIQRTLFS